VDLAVEGAAITKFRNTGQSCIASNRIYVQDGIYDRFIEKFTQRVKRTKVGDGMEEGVEVGALINSEALDTALAHIANAQESGGKVLAGGKQWGDKGYLLEPTLIADVPDEALCMNEETFAPLAPVARFTTTRATGSRRTCSRPTSIAASASPSSSKRGPSA